MKKILTLLALTFAMSANAAILPSPQPQSIPVVVTPADTVAGFVFDAQRTTTVSAAWTASVNNGVPIEFWAFDTAWQVVGHAVSDGYNPARLTVNVGSYIFILSQGQFDLSEALSWNNPDVTLARRGTVTFSTPVPEPTTAMLIFVAGLGFMCLVAARLLNRKQIYIES